ncbi:hypothetical protein PISL3812_02269 [Talaromyces islandicus]|uniref:Enoyl reductase (ER) domain-containing protein n=1 Tax=Talaromyces islandicus TaxID=28573 RepID=A0A0U1LPQ5_TALIS|nr:hypothetical protein PISL3812_02269 [Talaromyces islandicus]
MASSEKSIAFIGLGVMGYHMALNLRKKIGSDYTILICDVVPAALQEFQDETAHAGPVKIINTGIWFSLCCQVRVYLDDKTGILAGIKQAASKGTVGDKVIMECGTIETTTILDVSKAIRETAAILPNWKLAFVDAPASGGPMGAQAGTLTFMVGADRATDTDGQVFSRVKGVLCHMGKPDCVFLCGEVGAGTAFKIVNNYLSAITSLAASEALNIGVKMGLDAKLLTDVINNSGGQCWVTSQSNPVPGVHPNAPASRDHEGGFRIELCKKVLGMGSQLAEIVGARTILDKPTLEAFEAAAGDERYKGKDARVDISKMSTILSRLRRYVHQSISRKHENSSPIEKAVVPELPSTMKAQHLDSYNTPYVLRDGVSVPTAAHPYDLLIRVDAASYCHTDHVLASGHMAAVEQPDFPHVGCHEFSGTVVGLPSNPAQTEFKPGDRIGVASRAYHPCGTCVECQEEKTPLSDPKGYSVLCPHVKTVGIGIDGGWREYAVVDSRQVTLIPEGLSQIEAAPLMCAGFTIYSAIQKAGLSRGQRLGIVGCGGGLGHLGLQYATAMGLKVYGIDNSDSALTIVRGLKNITGATIVDARTQTAAEVIAPIAEEDGQKFPGQFGLDGVIILAESQKAFQYGVDMLKNHGNCVVVSFPQQGFHISSMDMIFRDIHFMGSLMGTNKQLRNMVRFSAEHGVKPVLKTFPLEKLNDLVDEYKTGHGGKLVIDFSL